jgi:hypothetical protein
MKAKDAHKTALLLANANEKIKMIERKIEETAMDGGFHIKFKYDRFFIHPKMAEFVLDSIAEMGYTIFIGKTGEVVISWEIVNEDKKDYPETVYH